MESMTGFGKGTDQKGSYTITVYAKSVNSRYLDIQVKLPRRYYFLEERVKKLVSQFFSRGKIEIWVKYKGTGLSKKEVYVDREFAETLKNHLETLRKELSFEDPLLFGDFLRFRDFIFIEEEEEELDILWEEIRPSLEMALSELKKSREKEGEEIKKVLKEYLEILKKTVQKIEEFKPLVERVKKEDYLKRIEKIRKSLELNHIDENRFYQELVFLLDRFDFSEELDRLKIHINNFEKVLEEEKNGKKLDFLCQEMFREINTLSNKAQHPEVSILSVKVKDLIEKLREQIQNVA